jgi:hypothetical protein
MGKVYKTAMGKPIDIDMLRLANEETIAIGNMRVNARGDELGPGGKVVKPRAQVMRDYHKLNTPVASDDEILSSAPSEVPARPTGKIATPVAADTPVVTSAPSVSTYTKPRGSFAEAVANETEVHTELLDPAPLMGSNKDQGVKRI